MKQKFYILFAWCLLFSLGVNEAMAYQVSSDPFCDCEDNLNPTFQLTTYDPTSCTATFTVNPGDMCLQRYNIRYVWVINGEELLPTVSSAGLVPQFIFEAVGSIEYAEVKVIVSDDTTGDIVCAKTASSAFSDVTCNSILSDITVVKQAYKLNGGVSTDIAVENVYTGVPFDWRVTITNTGVDEVAINYRDTFDYIFNDEAMPYDGEGNEDCNYNDNPVMPGDEGYCPFTYNEMDSYVTINGTDTTIVPMVDTFTDLTIPANSVVVLNYRFIPCDNGFNRGYFYRNDFTWSVQDIGVPPGETTRCDYVKLSFGCPITLTDGACLEPDELEAGDTITSYFAGHTEFYDVTSITGILSFDHTVVDTPEIELDLPELNGFMVSTTPVSDDAYEFIISSDTGASFDIASTGTWAPFAINAVLLVDLEGCTQFDISNLVMESNDITQEIPIDSGVFCAAPSIIDDPDYDNAWITAPVGTNCVGITPVTLTAAGPFLTNHPATSYTWSNDLEGQSIEVTGGGTYSVDITDQNGCYRYAEITIPSCQVTCGCDDLNPVVDLSIENACYVRASVSINTCTNVSDIRYFWKFTNSPDLFEGEFPPLQSNLPLGGMLGAKVIVKYKVDGVEECKEESEGVSIFIPCRQPKKKGMKIYPNPASNDIKISLEHENLSSGTVEIFNTSGLILLNGKYNSANEVADMQLDVSRLKPGVYFVKFIDKNGIDEIKRLVIE